MSEIAVIGLGIMGAPMAANLAAAGHSVRGFSRSAGTRAAAAEHGVTAVESAAEAVAGAEVVITMLPDTPDVEAVVLGDGGIAPALRPGVLFIDMSSIEPAMAVTLHERLGQQGVDVLDAPVSGGQAGAIEGTLSIMVGGDAEVALRARPILEVLGSTVVHVGPVGAGQSVKAANQLMVAGHLQMLAEALVLLRAQGVDLERALDVLGAGLAGSTVIQRKRANYLGANFTPGFRLALHQKDLGIVENAAERAGVSLPLTTAVTALVRELVAQGHGDLDHSALYLLATESNGLSA